MAERALIITGTLIQPTLAPGLPVLRALRQEPAFQELGLRIVAVSYDPLGPVGYDPELCDDCYLFPYPMHGAQRLLERIKHVHAQTRVAAILPTLDSEIPNYIEIAPRLREMGIGLVLPSLDAFNLRSKARLPDIGPRTGLLTPASFPANSVAEAHQVARVFPYPLVVKGRLHSATVVYSNAQLSGVVESHAAKWGWPVVIQEFVQGVEFDVVALGDARGRLIGAVPMKKLQIDEFGKAWGAVTVDEPELLDLARRAVEGLVWYGPLELELIRETATGRWFLIEINPRFPAWINLACAAGQNLPWALLRMALGERVPPFPSYRANVMQLRRAYDVTCDLGVYEALVTTGEAHLRALDPARIQPETVLIPQRPVLSAGRAGSSEKIAGPGPTVARVNGPTAVAAPEPLDAGVPPLAAEERER